MDGNEVKIKLNKKGCERFNTLDCIRWSCTKMDFSESNITFFRRIFFFFLQINKDKILDFLL